MMTIAITSGEDFADALSIAPIASIKNMPVLLSPKDNLDKNILILLMAKTYTNPMLLGIQVLYQRMFLIN